ncbi:mandelate racemase/muconate lactonizing family protein [Citrobacter koseri]|uniref:Mandelate racemase/muconate lactonizing family protein n=1 Tax=Citrobacter koseri TaxID=545 RepID=A0A2X2WNX1_CITKO|nr:mandelate racemase/muconate lactonizing family protein [Citrobacter koseri]
MRSVKVYEEAWPLHTPFVIARGSRTEAHVVVVELGGRGRKRRRGMYALSTLWRKRCLGVLAQIMSIAPQLEQGLTREALQKLLPAGAARNAVDCALWGSERSPAASKRWRSLWPLNCPLR